MVSLTATNGGPAPMLPVGPAAKENENWNLCGIQIVSDPNGFGAGSIDNQIDDLKPSCTQIMSNPNGFLARLIDDLPVDFLMDCLCHVNSPVYKWEK